MGKYADILVFDALSSSMVCAAQHDPVAALVLHSSPADLEMVMVGGEVRKRDWMLEAVDVGKGEWAGREGMVGWREVARELVGRREELERKVSGLDFGEAERAAIREFGVEVGRIVEGVVGSS